VKRETAKPRQPHSLWLRLVVSLLAAMLLAVGAATAVLYLRFKNTDSQFRDHTLQNHARIISRYIRRLPPGTPIKIPDDIALPFEVAQAKYAIIDSRHRLIDGSPGLAGPMADLSHEHTKDYFVFQSANDEQPLYGLSVKSPSPNGDIWVQVAFRDHHIVFDSILEEFVEDIAWIWGPFVAIILLVNLIVVRISLRPLLAAARSADAIGPRSENKRLSQIGLPGEVLALVSAVNRALDRMGVAMRSQRLFIADAAHELRTPVAVLKAHAAVLPPFEGSDALMDEICALERLANQLLDSARLDGLSVEPQEASDLNQLASDVASQLGPFAIAYGRSIEVLSAQGPVIINGKYDFLKMAVRNLVENAIKHTPAGTTVSIQVAAPGWLTVTDRGPGIQGADRQNIFKRFWQGGRDRAGGAGLGLDIVARTIIAHRGEIWVDDAPGGGAVFAMKLPALSPAA
jgi:signal transduction histidine kinase